MSNTQTTPEYSDILVSKRWRFFARQRHARLQLAVDAAELDRRPGARVLDLGCADGIAWPLLRGRVGSLVGVNYDAWLTEQCRRRNPDEPVLRADARCLPFAATAFDVIICLEMFHYLPVGDRAAGIRELYRVLRPAGRLVLTVPIEVGLPGLLKFVGRCMGGKPYPSASAHAHMLWRRVLYRFVDIREDRRRINFHFNAWRLRDQLREVFPRVVARRIPFVYPFVTTALFVADKSP
ncbi:MAG: methyltransferase domain-containing protein [Phycisphaerae bacterium]|nr:methyltransferase domain-containing protein [Phycisphaerae bacterium]NUQ47155.1 methyltransferase domain-containing protein [Phycisphaerae bacterium]